MVLGWGADAASVGTVTAKSSSAAPTATSGMARFVDTPATTTSVIPMFRSTASTSVRCTGEIPWCRGSTRSSVPTPISVTTSMAGSESFQPPVAAVARISGAWRPVERPPASGT